MTTIVRRRLQPRLGLGPYKRHELLTGHIRYPARGYTGYGDGSSTNVADFISDQMCRDWEANHKELIAFWHSGEYTTPKIFPDSLPWLFVCGSADTLPWAARHLLTANDRNALALAIATDRAHSADHARQIDALLNSEPWEAVGKFCAYRCQMRSMSLPLGELPPVLIGFPNAEVAAMLDRFAGYAARFN